MYTTHSYIFYVMLGNGCANVLAVVPSSHVYIRIVIHTFGVWCERGSTVFVLFCSASVSRFFFFFIWCMVWCVLLALLLLLICSYIVCDCRQHSDCWCQHTNSPPYPILPNHCNCHCHRRHTRSIRSNIFVWIVHVILTRFTGLFNFSAPNEFAEHRFIRLLCYVSVVIVVCRWCCALPKYSKVSSPHTVRALVCYVYTVCKMVCWCHRIPNKTSKR